MPQHKHRLQKGSPQSSAILAGATYTCPMHPQVEADKPGSCPECGMALESRAATTEEESPELAPALLAQCPSHGAGGAAGDV